MVNFDFLENGRDILCMIFQENACHVIYYKLLISYKLPLSHKLFYILLTCHILNIVLSDCLCLKGLSVTKDCLSPESAC